MNSAVSIIVAINPNSANNSSSISIQRDSGANILIRELAILQASNNLNYATKFKFGFDYFAAKHCFVAIMRKVKLRNTLKVMSRRINSVFLVQGVLYSIFNLVTPEHVLVKSAVKRAKKSVKKIAVKRMGQTTPRMKATFDRLFCAVNLKVVIMSTSKVIFILISP